MIDKIVEQEVLSLDNLYGKWYINFSNFPMWLKGDKMYPTFNYTKIIKGENTVLLDEVKYFVQQKENAIVGYDHPVSDENRKFIWREKGLLGLLKSKWEILHYDAEDNWMLIYFEKTLFTPKGYDIVSRAKTPSKEVTAQMHEVLKTLDITEALKTIIQE